MSVTRDMSCREFIDLIYALLAEELAPEQRASADAHLAICDACQSYLQNYQITTKLLERVRDEPDAPLPDDVPDALIDALIAAREAGREQS